MLGLLIVIALATTTFAMFMLIVASRRWNARILSAARVEALRALVAESPVETQSPLVTAPAILAASSPAAAIPQPRRRTRTSDDWNDVVEQLWGQSKLSIIIVAATLFTGLTVSAQQSQSGTQGQTPAPGFSFRTGVELINVTATVTDAQGRFVSGLKVEDFEVYEDGKRQTISQFDSERVPVSLGIALDTSGSMAGEKIAAAQAAVNRFLYDLLGENDEVFLFRFDSRVQQVSGWTEDRKAVGRMLGSISPNGGTAMYDAVAATVPLAQQGTRRKKALILISDGNDQNSRSDVDEVRRLIRESEVLVYAIGIDASGSGQSSYSSGSSGSSTQSPPVSVPSPFPGAKRPPSGSSTSSGSSSSSGSSGSSGSGSSGSASSFPGRRPSPSNARLNVDALRAITDDSGGRTEIIVSPRDLDPATAGIASELSRQYFLGYSTSSPKDGRWHNIEVRVRRGNYTIRARKGFIAS